MLAEEKLETAYKNDVLKPHSKYESKDDYHHLIMIIVFCLGRYFLLRGGKEISMLQ